MSQNGCALYNSTLPGDRDVLRMCQGFQCAISMAFLDTLVIADKMQTTNNA